MSSAAAESVSIVPQIKTVAFLVPSNLGAEAPERCPAVCSGSVAFFLAGPLWSAGSSFVLIVKKPPLWVGDGSRRPPHLVSVETEERSRERMRKRKC